MFFEKIIFFLICLIFFCVTRVIHVNGEEIMPNLHRINLPNGISTLIKKNHRSPVVAVQVWVKAGSVYEMDKEAGITHLIEHMLFKGTEKRKAGEVAKEIETVGGSINAFTSLDYTCYHCEVPKEHLSTALEVLSDVLFNSKFDPKELEREKEVVIEEIKMREDKPETRLSRLVLENVYINHPYRRPVIGFEQTVRSITRSDILNYMKRRYKNNNMRLIIVGDVDLNSTISIVSNTFGKRFDDIGQIVLDEKIPLDSEQNIPRIKTDKMDVQQYYLSIAFSGIPNVKSPDVAVLDVLSSLLTGGYSSVFIQELRNKKMLVQKIDTASFTPLGPGFFEIEAILQGEKLKEALEEIFYYLWKYRDIGCEDDELNKAKLNVTSSFIHSIETMEGEARKIGLFEIMTDDPLSEKLYLERVKAVTPDDIKRVINRYFKVDKANLTVIQPKDSPDFNATPNLILDISKKAQERVNSDLIKKDEKKTEKVFRTKLSSGLDVIIRESKEIPSVSFHMIFWGGLRYENNQNNGIFNFLAQAWNRGTKNLSSEEFAKEIDKLGGMLSGYSGQNTFGITGRFLSENLNKGLELLSDMILNPTFSPDEMEKLRPIILSQIKAQEDSLSSLAILEMRKTLFSPHPYSMRILGTEDTVKRFTSIDLINTWKDYVRPDNGIFVIVGDVKKEDVIKRLDELIGINNWKGQGELKKVTPTLPDPLLSNRINTIKRDKQQVHIVLGFPGVTFNSKERYSLEVLNAILAGQSGRLFTTLRDKESLAYSVTSFMATGIETGSFAFYIACSPDKRDDAIRGLWREISGVINSQVTKEELERAKNWITGNYVIDLQTNSAKALDMGTNELYGLGFDFSDKYIDLINLVTLDDVQNVAKKILTPDRYVLIQVGQ